mmetsp:Transcript_29159/g.44040  ORF Transcript_29159/g.44040 Transcript_29159/m.44040 type:complete len:82 (-) Transcript_29159:36-281(-)|eukprot:CAMPEP_0206536938 /NCGR_PEP_ID=MMETSP0325_2-20121206/7042_1 /ASSEMBLY_ACC=CAM_ASM_000347 /TAXON_ID=2866 /ORGANISM="Crypthecodinium cohnii, Strain Seligo" /LENGTH=81 /DNA_ID=CAMNT_0054034235 /DNA_START=99 /DNA_END=344 /DNA_ORIENTATION=-
MAKKKKMSIQSTPAQHALSCRIQGPAAVHRKKGAVTEPGGCKEHGMERAANARTDLDLQRRGTGMYNNKYVMRDQSQQETA